MQRFIRFLAVALGGLLLLTVLSGPESNWHSRAFAQNRFVDKSVRVGVPIFEENLDDAKSRAVSKGKRELIRKLMQELLAEEWVTLFEKELNQRILRRADRFITTYQMQGQQTSIDRTTYYLILAAQVNRAQLMEELQGLNLPLKSQRPESLRIFYQQDDPVMGKPSFRKTVLDILTPRLKLLNLKTAEIKSLTAKDATVLEDAATGSLEGTQDFEKLVRRRGMLIRFETIDAQEDDKNKTPGIKGTVRFYQKADPFLLGAVEHMERNKALVFPLASNRALKQFKQKMITPLVNRIIPGTVRLSAGESGEASSLGIRVLGIKSMEDEEAFEQAFFKRSSRFESFSLYKIASSTMTYRGKFSGDQSLLEQDLRGKSFGDFKIRDVYWHNGVLELDVERRKRPVSKEMTLYPREKRTLEITKVIDNYFTKYAKLEVRDPTYKETEDNGWLNRANPLPFNLTLYGFVDSRGDSDFYMGEALEPGETLELVWYRISRTQLSPVIRIYNEKGLPVKIYHPRSWARIKFTIPKGQHRFYVEIADRFGYIKADTGGYRDFNYLFKVNRNRNRKVRTAAQ